MGRIGEITWINYIAQQVSLPPDETRKRLKIHYWKDEIEIYDLGIFVPFLEAENAKKLVSGGLGIVYARSQKDVETNAKEYDMVRIYTYPRYLAILLAECSDVFEIFDSKGSKIQPNEIQKKLYEKNRDMFLAASKFRRLRQI